MTYLTNLFKLLYFATLYSLLIITYATADINNDICPGEELVIENGVNVFPGNIERNGIDYYYITVPADGNITITWRNTAAAANKKASVLVGNACNSSLYYDGTLVSNYHQMTTRTFSEGNIIFIKIYNGEGNNYDLTIDYEVDTDTISDYPVPSFCYDYYYQQNSVPLNETEPPYIEDNVTLGSDININLSIRNIGNITDLNSSYYQEAYNVTLDILNIDSTNEAIYSRGTTYLRKPGAFYREYIPDSELTVSDAYIKDIDVGDMGTQQFFAVDFSITPEETELSFPLNATMTYDVSVQVANTYVLIPQEILLQDMPKCQSNDSGYVPAYSIFNIEHNALTSDAQPIYNLPTQTAMRVDDLQITSYRIDALHTRNPVRTIVGVELIDANKHGNIIDSCAEEDSAISPRITEFFWGANDTNITNIPFDKDSIQTAINSGYISDQILNPGGDHISSAAEFYDVARENAAFRISYNTLNDGSLIQIEEGIHPGTYRIANFPNLVQEYPYCKQPVKNPNNQNQTELTPVACSNAGQSSSLQDIAICMECIYGYRTRYLCSRDNFAIRPESYRVSMSDQAQESPSLQSHIKTNFDNNQINIVAGYQYGLEINATNYINENNTLGYDSTFISSEATEDKYFSFVWQHSGKDSFCNDISDHNKTKSFKNGELVLDNNISNSDVGEYKLEIVDKLWTKYDHDSTLLTHHSTHPIHGDVADYFISGIDCEANVTTVPVESYDSNYVISGCDIRSEHTRYDTVTQFTSINTRIHPYKFDLNSSILGNPVTPMVGPNLTRDQTFVYIDTPPTMDANDTNMSYNMNGTFVAAGYDSNVTSNFVTGCYADNLNMTLDFIYNYGDVPTITPFLSYSLKDYNTTGSVRPGPSSIYDLEVGIHDSTTTPFIIDQNATNFSKDMNGAIRMNLGYNFARTYNQVLNPRYIQFNDFNITYATNPSNVHADLTSNHQIYGDRILDQNVSFFYGRAKPGKFFYEDVTSASVNTPISILIYCGDDMSFTDCSNRGVQTAFAQTNEANWWLSLDHNTAEDDGDVVLVEGAITEGGSGDWSVTPNVNIVTNAIDTNIIVDRGTNPTLPLTVEIDLDTNTVPPLLTNRWLIYNEYYNSIPSPFYKVRFIGISGWAGHGDTGHVVDSNESITKNRRMEW